MCRCFDTIPACDRQTDRRTDRQTDGIAVASTALAMRALRRATWSAVLSVCLSVTTVSPAKTAEPIQMPFWMCTRMSPFHSDPHRKGHFGGDGFSHTPLCTFPVALTSGFPRMVSASIPIGRPYKQLCHIELILIKNPPLRCGLSS